MYFEVFDIFIEIKDFYLATDNCSKGIVVRVEILQSLRSFRMTWKNASDIKNCKVVRAEVLRCAQNDKKSEWLGKIRVTKIFQGGKEVK